MGIDESLARLESLLTDSAKPKLQHENVMANVDRRDNQNKDMRSERISVLVKHTDGRVATIPTSIGSTVHSLKEKILKIYGHAVETQVLLFNGQALSNGDVLSTLDIMDETSIFLKVKDEGDGQKMNRTMAGSVLKVKKHDKFEEVDHAGEHG